jgi:hypothetical protein
VFLSHYDLFGKIYTVKKTYFQIPTATNSFNFLLDSMLSLSKMMDEKFNMHIHKTTLK